MTKSVDYTEERVGLTHGNPKKLLTFLYTLTLFTMQLFVVPVQQKCMMKTAGRVRGAGKMRNPLQ